jgi:hypothetical protein
VFHAYPALSGALAGNCPDTDRSVSAKMLASPEGEVKGENRKGLARVIAAYILSADAP